MVNNPFLKKKKTTTKPAMFFFVHLQSTRVCIAPLNCFEPVSIPTIASCCQPWLQAVLLNACWSQQVWGFFFALLLMSVFLICFTQKVKPHWVAVCYEIYPRLSNQSWLPHGFIAELNKLVWLHPVTKWHTLNFLPELCIIELKNTSVQ